jgi:Sap, sulfolipid-1-addressing protein
MDILTVLPLAFVMIAGPQIISAFFFATADSWRSTSAAYVLGAALSITLVTSVGFLLANVIGDDGGGDSGLSGVDYAILGLLAFAIVRTYLRRGESEPPKWMGKLQEATPKLAFVLGFLLLGFFPSDVVTSITVGSHLGDRGDTWWALLPFVALTLLLLSAPALMVAALGRRAQTVLPKLRDWMTTNSWIVSEVVLVFFVAIVLSG